MILLNEIKLKNFLSHSNSTVTFNDRHQMLIDGDSGAGKSSIIDAIVWCLYGRGRSDNRSLIKQGEKSAKVTLTLKNDREDIGGVEYFVIVRRINDKGKHELFISSRIENNTEQEAGKESFFKPIKVSGLKNLQEYLETQILNSSYLLFINSIVYPQDNTENFVKQTAAKRKDILLEIIKASSYDSYYKKANKKIDECKSGMLLNDGLLENIEPVIKQDLEFVEKHKDVHKEMEKLKADFEIISTKEKKVRDKLNLINLKGVEMTEKRSRLTDLEDRQTYCLRSIDKANKLLIEMDDTMINKLEQEVTKLSSLKKELNNINNTELDASEWHKKMLEINSLVPVGREFDTEIEEINRQLIEIEKQKVPRCHKCAEPYKFAIEDKETRSNNLNSRLIKVKTEKEEYVKNLEGYNKSIKAFGECPVVDKDRKDVIISEIADLEIKEKELTRLKTDKQFFAEKCTEEIADYKKEIEELNKKTEVLSSSITKLLTECKNKTNLKHISNELSTESNDINSSIRVREGIILMLKNAAERLKDNEDRYNNLKASKTSLGADLKLLVLIKDAFGSNGIKSIMIDYIIPRLEEKINSILGELSDFRIRLDTQRSSVAGDNTVEGLFISILNEAGEEFDFDNYSGSEKLRIMYAISEGLASIQKFGFRILDETLHGFDKDVEDKFTRIIFRLQQKVAQFVCVSHITSIKELFSEKIIVKKANGNSVVE